MHPLDMHTLHYTIHVLYIHYTRIWYMHTTDVYLRCIHVLILYVYVYNTIYIYIYYSKLREIEQIIGTKGGHTVLALCSDGGVLLYNTCTEEESEKGVSISPTSTDSAENGHNSDPAQSAPATSLITELEYVSYNPETDRAWALKQLYICDKGSKGGKDSTVMETVLIQATSNDSGNYVMITPLKVTSR